MVIDVEQLIDELETLEADFPGISSRFYLDPEAFIVLPWHKEEDLFIEEMRKVPIGTTGKGIGPSYTDKVSREGLKLYVLFDESLLKERLEALYHMKRMKYNRDFTLSFGEMTTYLLGLKTKLERLSVNFTSAVDMFRVFRSTSILFEGAQGVLLDLDFGTYPFVTSGACMAHGVSSVGFSTFELDNVYGVLKAYTTRVGSGPFPTEEFSEVGNLVRERGKEYGATTGRARRVGWLDLPALRYARIRSGLTGFVITKGDVLNGLDEVKVCVAYDVEGAVKEMPSTSYDFFKARPIYETVSGWPSTDHINFLKYMTFIERETGVEIDYISYGPRTEEMKTRNDLIMNI